MTKKHAVVFGASSGIGRALAIKLSSSCKVSIVSRRELILKEICSQNENMYPYVFDLSCFTDYKTLLDEIVSDNGKLDYLFFTAGAFYLSPHRRLKVNLLNDTFNINLLSPVTLGQYFLSENYTNDNAVYSLVSSIAAQNPSSGQVAYAASKAGLDGFVRALSKEVFGGRRVFGVAPGWLDSEMTRKYSMIFNSEFVENLSKQAPMGIFSVEDIANTLIELSTNQTFLPLNGNIIPVDGSVKS